MDNIQKNLLAQVAGLHEIPEGAYNIRSNGESSSRNTTANIDIVTKKDKPGIDIIIKPNTVKESVHIPVIITKTGVDDLTYNDFYVGENSDVTIVAGCGIHNTGDRKSQHNGIHSFHIGKNARVLYVERHYGEGDGNGENIMNPTTIIEIEDGGYLEMETTQIKGIDSTIRETKAVLGNDAKLVKKGIDSGCGTDAPGSYIAWLSTQVSVHAMEMPGKRYDIGNLESYENVKKEYKGICYR